MKVKRGNEYDIRRNCAYEVKWNKMMNKVIVEEKVTAAEALIDRKDK